MQVTTELIKKKFIKFNNLMFQGKLPLLPIQLTTSRSYLGRLRMKKQRTLIGRSACYEYVLQINTKFELSDEKLEDVIIHEMIHYYIHYFKIHDTSVHGKVFKHIMNEINTHFGRHITVSNSEKLELNEDRSHFAVNYVLVATLPSGERAICVSAHTRIFFIDDNIDKFYKTTSRTWYGSIEPYFTRFPRSRTPRLYKVDEEELSKALETATELERKGDWIRPKE